MQAARIRMVNELKPGSTPERALDALKQYATCLSTCACFPGHADAARKRSWATNWTDLGTVKEDRLEWAVVLAHLGLVHAQAGKVHAAQSTSDPDRLSRACEQLQWGAGFFGVVSSMGYLDTIPASPAVGRTYASAYQNLLVAQAQVCAVERALQLKKSNGLCSQLAQGAADMFDKTLNALTSLPRKVEWHHYVAMMGAYFHMRALKLAADDCVERPDRQCGVAIAHLKAALKFHPGTKYASMDRDLQAVLDSLKEAITTMLSDCEKNNATVYFQPIPTAGPQLVSQLAADPRIPQPDGWVDPEMSTMLRTNAGITCHPAPPRQVPTVRFAPSNHVQGVSPAVAQAPGLAATSTRQPQSPNTTPNQPVPPLIPQQPQIHGPLLYPANQRDSYSVTIQKMSPEEYEAAKLGISVKAYRIKKEQEEYERRKQEEGAGASSNSRSSRVPVSVEDEEAQFAKALENSLRIV